MFNFFAGSEVNLGRAGWLLVTEILGGAALGFALSGSGLDGGMALIVVWLVNLAAAWFIGKAAVVQGRNGVVHGLLSAVAPPLAILSFITLLNHDAMNA